VPLNKLAEALIFMRYAIVIERGSTSYGAYVPDLPGCVAAANTRDEVLHLIRRRFISILRRWRVTGLRFRSLHRAQSMSRSLRSDPSAQPEISFALRKDARPAAR
jgi:hypothetical protein